MKISLFWLRDLVAYDGSVGELCDLLANLGFPIESVERVSADWSGVVVGRVLSAERLAGTDHLTTCLVDVGGAEALPVICGAPNVASGQTVPVAQVGATLPGGFHITERKMRGTISRGMICSERELGLSEDHSGIMVLDGSLAVGKPLDEALGRGDTVLDVEVTFNRPDCLSHLGIAREIAAKTGLSLTMPEASPVEIEEPASDWISVEIRDKEKCPRYTARIVKGIKVAPSPQWMQNRLRAVGIRPISNVVDVTNYVMMELGHPLHAFDYHLVRDSRIIIRRASEGESFVTLDDKEHKLTGDDLLIADVERGIALAGVMGGLNSEINDQTSDVLIECAFFEPQGIRRTSRERGVQSESSRRFERGVDVKMTSFAAARTSCLIQRLAGGEVLHGEVDAYPVKWKPTAISLRPGRANALLGTELTPGQMTGCLEALGCCIRDTVIPEAGVMEVITVEAPSWRQDLESEIDLVEEVARLHGYDSIPLAEVSSVPLSIISDAEQRNRAIGVVKQAMVELGFYEASSWSLISNDDACRWPDVSERIKVLNPLSEDLATLRSSLAPSLLRAVERNINNGINDVRLFEWGSCFRMEAGEIREEPAFAAIVCGDIRPESWLEKPRPFTIYDLKAVVERLLQRAGLDNYQIIPYDIPVFLNPGAKITGAESNEIIGQFGEIDEELTRRFGIERPVWYIELGGAQILEGSRRAIRYVPAPKYPPVRRDLAFLADVGLESGRLQAVMAMSAGALLQQIELFDLYGGKGIPEGKRSLAYHLTFRSLDRTLEDAEVDQLMTKIIAAAKEAGAELRG